MKTIQCFHSFFFIPTGPDIITLKRSVHTKGGLYFSYWVFSVQLWRLRHLQKGCPRWGEGFESIYPLVCVCVCVRVLETFI